MPNEWDEICFGSGRIAHHHATQIVNENNSGKPKLLGWYVGLGVLLITLGVLFGLVGIFVVAKKKQRYRINEPVPTTIPTNSIPSAALASIHHVA